jgi:hypothetical protein
LIFHNQFLDFVYFCQPSQLGSIADVSIDANIMQQLNEPLGEHPAFPVKIHEQDCATLAADAAAKVRKRTLYEYHILDAKILKCFSVFFSLHYFDPRIRPEL